jgi:hypothetical protein
MKEYRYQETAVDVDRFIGEKREEEGGMTKRLITSSKLINF